MALTKLEPKDFISKIPTFPDFPYAEYERRINKAKELMNANEVDCLVLWSRPNVRYFFGLRLISGDLPSPWPGLGIIPLDGDPFLIVNDLVSVSAQEMCWTRDIMTKPRAHVIRQQRELPKEVAAVLRERGYGSKNIALEMGPLGNMYIPIPLNDIEAMKNGLPDASFVDGDRVIWGCRMIKSPLEIERMRQACAIVKRCHSAVVNQFKPGMTEADVANIIHHIQVDSGGLQEADAAIVHHIVCSQYKEGMLDILAFDNLEIGRDDYLQLDLCHRHKGYWADVARIFQVGPITDKIRENYKLIEECMLRAEEMIKPGAIISELYKYGHEPLVKAGVEPMENIGHCIGMDIHEPPDLDGDTHEPLQEGMTLSVEVWTFQELKRKGGTGILGLEDEYVVTNRGFEKFPSLPRDVIHVAYPFD